MFRSFVFGLTAAFVGVCATSASAEVKSGLKVGEKPPAFNVRDVTGPSAGESLCYRCQFGQKPVVNVFTRELNDSLASLITSVDQKIGSGEKDLKSFVVFLTDDADAAEKQLKEFAKKHNIKNIPLTIAESAAGPPNYKIAEDAAVTVHLWSQSEVKANHAFATGKLDKKSVEQIVGELPKILKS